MKLDIKFVFPKKNVKLAKCNKDFFISQISKESANPIKLEFLFNSCNYLNLLQQGSIKAYKQMCDYYIDQYNGRPEGATGGQNKI